MDGVMGGRSMQGKQASRQTGVRDSLEAKGALGGWEDGDCNIYRSEIINEDTSSMDVRQNDGIDGLAVRIP